MIPATIGARQPGSRPHWQQQLAAAITDPAQLIAALGLPRRLEPAAREAARAFPLRVPWSYVRRMRRADPADPLLRQVLPLGAELRERAGYVSDPLRERAALRAPGLLQKYRGRALIVTSGACAVNCRYCFRREFPYPEQSDTPRWHAALAEIARDTTLEEIILSGGDPLALSDARLGSLTRALAQTPHVRRLRIHTRLPIVLPARIDAGLDAWLRSLPWPVVIVVHANHANELDEEVLDACARLRAAGATLLNQSVLLAGVNDTSAALAQLSRRLFEAGVLPYYPHALDRVRGAAHFAVGGSRARRLAGELAAQLPGYLVPRLVREQADAPAKVALAPLLPP